MSEIRNLKHLQQVPDFEGLSYERNIRPTDIDVPPFALFLDFASRLFIIGECKHEPADMETGQRMAMEAMCDAWEDGGVKCYALFAWHNEEGPTYLVRNAIVKGYRTNRGWHVPINTITVGEAILKIKAMPIPQSFVQRRAQLAIEANQNVKPGYVCLTCRIAEKGWIA